MTASPRASVVVLNWNGLQKTRECLASLQAVAYEPFDVILVDNASSDGSQDMVRREFPGVALIENDTNRGVAGGRNVGLREAMARGSDYVLLLDNDTRVDPAVLTELVAAGEADPSAGILGAKIYHDGEGKLLWGIGGGMDLKRCHFDIRGFGEEDRGQYDQIAEVPYVMGCAQMVKRRVIETVGYMDEGFVTYFAEDTDLCLRAKAAGLRSIVVPTALVWHKVARGAAGSRTTGNDNYHLLKGRNLLYFMRKHATASQWLFFSVYMLFGASRAFVREARRGNLRGYAKMVQGALRGLRT
jgi:GT2 family glycosyltransferase